MTIILLKFSTACQTTQGTRSLISVQNTEVCNTHRKLTVTTFTVAEQNEVPRAVHGLQSPLALLDIQLEHIILVVGPVSGGFPDADIVHIGGLDLLVASLAVFTTQKGLELVEDLGSVRKEEWATGGRLIEEEQLLLLANSQMVPLFSFLQKLQVLSHQLLVGEGNTTNTLQRVVGLIAKEVGR